MFVMYAGHLESFCEECFQLVYPEVTNSYKFKADLLSVNPGRIAGRAANWGSFRQKLAEVCGLLAHRLGQRQCGLGVEVG